MAILKKKEKKKKGCCDLVIEEIKDEE